MKFSKLLILVGSAVLGIASQSSAQQLSGAGATFPAPLYQRWGVEYNKLQPAVQVNYQSVGSGAGVKNFTPAWWISARATRR